MSTAMIVSEQPAAVATRAEGADRSRLAWIDGLRACLALYVMLFHTFIAVWPGNNFWYRGGMFWMHMGGFAVASFIVVSGFCLAIPLKKHGLSVNTAEFYRRRAWRILPVYIAATALDAVLDLAVHHYTPGQLWSKLWPSFFFLQDLRGLDNIVCGVTWSLAVEVKLYILFPAIVWAMRRFGVARTITALTPVFTIVGCYVMNKWATGQLLSIEFYGGFLLGMGAYLLSLRHPKAILTGAIAGFATGLALRYNLGMDNTASNSVIVILWLVSTAGLMAYTSQSKGLINRALSGGWLKGIGEASYSLYLFHAPILFALGLAGRPVLALACCLMIIALSRGLFILLEAPFMRHRPAPSGIRLRAGNNVPSPASAIN